jgi:hypothetical protein
MCKTNAEWPDSPSCKCGWLKLTGANEITKKPHLRLVVDPEESNEPRAEA